MRSVKSSTTRRLFLVALGAIVLVSAAFGVCIVESGHGAHGNGSHTMFVDLCTGLFLMLPAIVFVVRPLLLGMVTTELATLSAQISMFLPDPPPKFVSAP